MESDARSQTGEKLILVLAFTLAVYIAQFGGVFRRGSRAPSKPASPS
ncbi:hypothetical protein ACF3MZ_28610 [Paenibacillaceae bacterium WGS1546]